MPKSEFLDETLLDAFESHVSKGRSQWSGPPNQRPALGCAVWVMGFLVLFGALFFGYRALEPDRPESTKLPTSSQGFAALSGHMAAVRAISFSSDDKRLFSGAGDGTIITWRVSDSASIGTRSVPASAIFSLDFTPENTVGAGCADGQVHLWPKGLDGPSVKVPVGGGYVRQVSFSHAGDQIAAMASGDVRVFQVPTLKPVLTVGSLSGKPNAVAWLSNGKFLSIISTGELLVSTLKGTEVRHRWKGEAVSGAADRLGNTVGVGFAGGVIRLYERPWVPKSEAKVVKVGVDSEVTAMAFRSAGVLAVGLQNGSIVMVSLQKLRPIQTMNPGCGSIMTIRFTHDGGTMAVAGTDQLVRLMKLPLPD